MLDLTGPQRPWSDRLLTGFGRAQQTALHSRGAWGPPRPGGDLLLLERLAELFEAPPDRVTVTAGVRALAAVWDTAGGCLVERPGFLPIPELLGDRNPVRQMPWADMFATARASAVPLTLWLTTPGRNPDGRSLSASEFALVRELTAAGHRVVVNRVYRWFAGPDHGVPSGAHADGGSWSVDSLSKLCGGGSRLGWVTGPEGVDHPAALRAAGPATIWQRSWASFLGAATLRSLHAQCVEPTLAARRAFLARVRETLDWSDHGLAGTSLSVAVPGVGERAAVAVFERHGLRVSPGSAFGLGGTVVRLAFSGVSESEAAAAADIVTRLAEEGALPRLEVWSDGAR
ncbi:hypothetical protein [Kitasatospora sp. NPDC097691]|uniref:hypothetical protein n=1 Tax=Kitasatospora sp. NPDC097691 TaxID=3157231 RepID=UPI00331BACDA